MDEDTRQLIKAIISLAAIATVIMLLFTTPWYEDELNERIKISEGKTLHENPAGLRGWVDSNNGERVLFDRIYLRFEGTEISWDRKVTVSYYSNTTSWLRVVDPVDHGTLIGIASKVLVNETYPPGYVSRVFDMNPCTGDFIIVEDAYDAYKLKTWQTMLCG